MRLLPTLGLLFGAILPSTLALQPNIGISAFIDPTTVAITPVDGPIVDPPVIPENTTTLPPNNTEPIVNLTQLVRAADSIEYAFVVPINLTRGSSPDSAFEVGLYVKAYDDDQDVEEDLQLRENFVFSDFIDFDGQSQTSTTARFNYTVSSLNNTVFEIRAEINTTTLGYSTTTAFVVVSHDAQTGTWTTTFRSTYEAQITDLIAAVVETLDSQSEPGEDTTSETVIDDPPTLPGEEVSDIVTGRNDTGTQTPPGGDKTPPGGDKTPPGGDKTPPGGDKSPPGGDKTPPGGDKTPPGGDNNKPPVTITVTASCPCDTKKPPKHKPTPWMGLPDHPDDKPWVHHPHSKPKDSWDTKPCTTTTPTPTPSPPCETNKDKDKRSWLQARQAKSASNLKLTLTFGSTAAGAVPVRQLPVYTYGTPSNGGKKIKATGKTNNKGEVTLRWNLPSGVSVTVGSIYVTLDAEQHRIVSTTDEKTFKTRTIRTTETKYVVSSGATVSKARRFVNAINIEYFEVHERVLTIQIYTKTTVGFFIKNGKPEKVAFWYPGSTAILDTSYFSLSGLPHISLYPGDFKTSTTIAHEFGHYIHYLARAKQTLNWGGAHNFCDLKPESETLAFGEGYATAFGILALRNSKYQPGSGTAYCWSPSDAIPANWNCREIDSYRCSTIAEADRNLATDEGRVAAALLDLVDTTVDNNGANPAAGIKGDKTLGIDGKTDNSNLSPRLVLLEAMRKNPASISAYWTNLKDVGKKLGIPTADDLNKAWEVFEFQYAKFSK